MRKAWVAFLLASPCLFAGCGPSVSGLIEWREELPEGIVETHVSLMDAFEEEGGALWRTEPLTPAWRMEAMTTLVKFDGVLDCKTQMPQNHERLIGLLKEEHNKPRLTKRASATDSYRVRAWSIHSLGQMRDPDLLGFLVTMVEETPPEKDPLQQYHLAALNALLLQQEALGGNSGLRNRLLTVLAAGHQAAPSAPTETTDSVAKIRGVLASRLRSYPAVVDTLPDADTGEMPEHALLEMLKWNYQFLASDSGGPLNPDVFTANVSKLGNLAWSPRARVRQRVRIILAERAPVRLLTLLTDALQQQRRIEEDAPLLANILPRADKAQRYDPKTAGGDRADGPLKEYSRQRAAALDALFKHYGRLDVRLRDPICGRLLRYDRATLCRRLLDRDPQAKAEGREHLSQHLRYLHHLRQDSTVLDTADRQRLATAIAGHFEYQDQAIRAQVASAILEDEPAVLAAQCRKQLPAVGEQGSTSAEYLLAVYLSCLERLEGDTGDTHASRDVAAEYECLSHMLARPEWAIRTRVVAFLAQRSCECLVKMLTADLNTRLESAGSLPIRDYALLGDVVQQAQQDALQGETRDAALQTIRTGILAADEETSLLCARYFVELGGQVSEEEARNAPAPTQIILGKALQRRSESR